MTKTNKNIRPKEKTGKFIITEDEFFSNYKPVINHIERAKFHRSVADEDVCSWSGCMFETFSPDIDYVSSMAKSAKTRNKVWTIVEGDNGEQIILAGMHRVNRMGYLITKKSWTSEEMEVATED